MKFLGKVAELKFLNQIQAFPFINTNALNKVTSPPPSPPLEGEGWGVKGIIAFVLVF